MSNHGYNITKYREQFPKEKLEKLLNNYTYRDLGKETGINEHVFSILAKEYGIKKNTKLISERNKQGKTIDFDYDMVYGLYINKHLSTRKIADIYSCSKCTVIAYMKKVGIPLREAHDLLCYESRKKAYSNYGIDNSGYVLIGINGKQIREHRYIMEQFLGRALNTDEHVHHIDFNKTNNDINNLFLFPSNTLHHLYHSYIENNNYISPQEFLEEYRDIYDEFLSFDNLYKLYITENRSIKDIAKCFCNFTDFNVNLMRCTITKKLKEYNLFDPNNIDINQYVTKDVDKLIEMHNMVKEE